MHSAGIPSLSFHAYFFFLDFFSILNKWQIDKKLLKGFPEIVWRDLLL